MPLPVIKPTATEISYHAESVGNATRFIKKFGSIILAETRWFAGKLTDADAEHNGKHCPHLFRDVSK